MPLFIESEPTAIDLLLMKGEEQGYVTSDDLLDIMPNVEDDLAQLEEVHFQLMQHGIKYHEAPPLIEKSANDVLPDLSDIEVDDSITLYLREIGHIPLLSPEREQELAKRLQRGHAARRRLTRSIAELAEREQGSLEQQVVDGALAREQLIKANSRLVVSIAKRHLGRGVPLQDLIQEGNLGLIRAVEKFDYRRGYKFSTYATWWIRQAITRSISDQGRTIRLPVHMGEQISRLNRTSRQLVQALGREPSTEELALHLGVTPQKIERIMKVAQRPLSLETSVGEEGDSTLGDFIEDETSPRPTDHASYSSLRDDLEDALACLTPREARVLQMRYGLMDGYQHTLEEVGEKFGVTRERIRQIEAQAIRRLRNPNRSERLREYLQ
ncbi:MAG: RNA polymerase sigma factor RpoD [Chloroflexi bacterium]|nr:RNA polymerase sigma factor RpoD [Chloroflexota bacterium]